MENIISDQQSINLVYVGITTKKNNWKDAEDLNYKQTYFLLTLKLKGTQGFSKTLW